jgi:PAS domain S-box-containing protein
VSVPRPAPDAARLEDPVRLASLRALELLDTPPDERFDRLVRTVASLLDVPIAVLNLVDDRRQWAKAAVGMEPGTSVDRASSFCAYVVAGDEEVAVDDTLVDERFVDNPLVVDQEPGLRCYLGTPVHAPDGQAVGSLCVAGYEPRSFDAAERQLVRDLGSWAEAELAREQLGLLARVEREVSDRLDVQRRRYEVILDVAADAIIRIDHDGIVEYANPAAHRLLGVPPGTLVGIDLHAHHHHCRDDGSPYPWDECPSQLTLRDGRSQHVDDERYLRADGTPVDVEYTSTPVFDDGEQVVGAVMVIRDVAARQELDRMKSAFVATVSHELRTPMTSIKGALSLVLSGVVGDLPPEARPLLEVAHDSSDRLVRLVNDLLDLSRLDAGMVVLHRAPVRAGVLIDEALRGVAAAAEQAQVTLVAATSEGMDAVVDVDRDRLVQVLTNLLGNAVRFSEAGGRVEVSAELAAGRVVLAVRDHGRGVPEEARERIFARFGQADTSDGRDRAGTGLGLAIARELTEAHGGELVLARVDVGSRFEVHLPRSERDA